MIYDFEWIPIIVFSLIVLTVLFISFYMARKSKSSKGYFAAGGTIHWGVNGIAFAGDYLSAASFLGICGLVATVGYDGFLYSIGFLAGWVVALFVVAEPMKRLGKYTFTDALDSKFNSRNIQLMAAISTLVVSICYLIPQMVGAGALVRPLLGIPSWIGVIGVGVIVILIVVTAGMKSTTYVQFIKGGLLIVFSLVLSIFVLVRGLDTKPSENYHDFQDIPATTLNGTITIPASSGYTLAGDFIEQDNLKLIKLTKDGVTTWWRYNDATMSLQETLSVTELADKSKLYNGQPKEERGFFQVGHMDRIVIKGDEVQKTGMLNIFSYFRILQNSRIVRFPKVVINDGDSKVTIWYQKPTAGEEILRPGLKFKIDKGSTPWSKLNFISLMLALFFGTAALPHVLIRYYTVPSPKDARKSTIVAIAAIGFFYILTLFMGLGAMTSGVIDLSDSNMAAPLLAKSFGTVLFSIVSAIAFATVLGTVSGLIVAASGAIAHDLMDRFMNLKLGDKGKVFAGKIAGLCVGIAAIVLGILFQGMNVSFLVGLAFAVAASANLPAILMLLFWKKTTAHGIAASILVGLISALTIILLSPSMFERYGMKGMAPIPLDNPGIISIPLSFVTLVIVSLLTQKSGEKVKT
jgi:cation/acetate symporter